MNVGIRHSAVLITDIARTAALRTQLGHSAAERRIRHLLDAIMDAVRSHGGEVVKSYGDDVLAVFETNAIPAAAATAIRAQRLAMEAGLPLYAGLHAGDVEFRETLGHPDAVGQTINYAARLHKLTEDAPGQIFLSAESVAALTPDLSKRAARFGPRSMKGIGTIDVWTLDWRDADTSPATVFVGDTQGVAPAALKLCHRQRQLHLPAGARPITLGRGPDCAIQIFDPIPRVSSAHLMIEFVGGRWFAQDVSRNGTWLRDASTGAESLLPYCVKSTLPNAGELCLGRPFGDPDAAGFVTSFSVESMRV